MKKICLGLICLVGYFIASSQNNRVVSDANAQKRNVTNFTSIQTEDGIDLFLSQGNEEAVAVSASKTEYRDKIITTVEDGVLKLSFDESAFNGIWRNRKLRAYISFTTLRELKASGGADVFIEGTISGSALALDISGGSDFTGKVRVTDLKIDQSGGSDVSIEGTAVNLRINANSGSDFDGYELKVETANVKATGGSDAELTVTRELDAQASSGSDIEYRGNPSVKRSNSTGGGSINKRG